MHTEKTTDLRNHPFTTPLEEMSSRKLSKESNFNDDNINNTQSSKHKHSKPTDKKQQQPPRLSLPTELTKHSHFTTLPVLSKRCSMQQCIQNL
jgi:hypothetical protein